MVLPWASVMVIIVLLNDAFTCATPEAMFLRSRLRTRVASLPMFDPFAACPARAAADYPCLLLLAGDRLGRSLAGAGIGVCALAAHREAATVAQPAIAAEIHQPLDVHRDIAPQVALD